MTIIYDGDKIVDCVHAQLSTLRDRYPEIAKDIEQASNNIITEIKAPPKFIITTYLTRQRFQYKMAGYFALSDERDKWFFYQAVMEVLAISDFEAIVKRVYKNEYPRLRDRLNRYGALLARIKYHLDHLEDKTLKDADVQNAMYVKAQELLEKFPLIYQDLDVIYRLIDERTNLGNITIPQQAISIFLQQYKKVTYDEQRKERPSYTAPPEE